MTTNEDTRTHARVAGFTAIFGAVLMLVGTALWAASGTDIDAALHDNTMGAYLTDAAANGTTLTANLGFWIVGVLILGLGGILLSRLGNRDSAAAAVARFAFTAGPASAIVFFSIWLGIVLGLAPAHVAGEQVEATALALGYASSIADWVATLAILALGGTAMVVAGRGTWAPRWLFRWAMVTAALGALAAVGLAIGAEPALLMPVVPVGMGLMIAAGVAAIRSGK